MDKPGQDHEPKIFTPSTFMQSLRPNLFSDSVQEPLPPWDEAQFAHFLTEITARKEETAFEKYARALVEAKICPNLLPQTGPTGGGDSKVDSETIPVADGIADRWYEGSASDARRERWAFAFSAKKAWRQKLDRDCLSIKSTNRGYQRIYFVTNQLVSDKKRAEAESAVAKRINKGIRIANRVDVRILDRTWITAVMFDRHHNRWNLVEEAFRLNGLARRYEPRMGPEDAKAHVRLVELDKEIEDPAKYDGAPQQLIEAWSASAILARRLGHPRESVEGRFNRALAIAEKVGSQRVAARVRYDLAWSSYWWFNDANAVVGLFDAILAGVPDDDKNAWDLEQLTNLYSLLQGAVRHGWLSHGVAQLARRAQRLDIVGQRLSLRRSHPTEAAWAHTQLLFRRLVEEVENPKAFERNLIELLDLLPEIERLEEYPLTQLVKCLDAIAEAGPWSETFNELSDRMTTLMQMRAGDQAASSHMLVRARQSLRSARPYDAIKLLGRAWEKLHRREARYEYIHGSLLAAASYESIGLLWAARAHLMLALSRAFRDLEEDGSISGHELAPLEMLARIELGLGRIAEFLETERLVRAVQATTNLADDEKEKFDEHAFAREMMLGALVVRAKEQDLGAVQQAPAIFEAEGQPIAAKLALFMLGEADALRTAEEMLNGNVSNLLQHPVTRDLPEPIWGAGERVLYSTEVGGCKVVIDIPNMASAKPIGEAIIAAMEAFLATAMLDRIAPSTDLLRVKLEIGTLDPPMRWYATEDDEGLPIVTIQFGGNIVPTDGRSIDYDSITSAVAVLVAHASLPNDSLDRLWKEDRMHERAFALASSIAASARLYGWNNRRSWMSLAVDVVPIPYVRSRWWLASTPLIAQPADKGSSSAGLTGTSFKRKDGELPQPNHRSVHNSGLVQVRLWDRAKWRGVAFETAEDPSGYESGVATIILGCLDGDTAAKIHRGLRRRLGPEDTENQLRICFITGIDSVNTGHYRVTVGANYAARTGRASDQIVLGATRIHTMEPSSTANLDRFWRVFSERGWCRLVVSGISRDNANAPTDIEPVIVRNVVKRQAWEIGPDDIDQAAILGNDSPIVPQGVQSRIAEVVESRRRAHGLHT